MNIGELTKSVGGLTKTSKMNCYSYSLPETECKTGNKLKNNPYSVCSNCYAGKNFYKVYEKTIKPAQYNRLNILLNDLKNWGGNFSALILRKKFKKFRWFDSGDIQSVEHAKEMIKIAENNPDTKFWLPTKEYAIYHTIKNSIPKNLCVRVSHPLKNAVLSSEKYKNHSAVLATTKIIEIDGKEIKVKTNEYINKFIAKYGEDKICQAYKNDGNCGTCEKCFDTNIDLIAYIEH